MPNHHQHSPKSHWRRKWHLLLAVGGAGLLIILLSNLWIIRTTHVRCHDSLTTLPDCDVALVLGANPASFFFRYRLEAAAELYHAGKVRHLLVSGDNGKNTYDETTQMKEFLIGRGVPSTDITCDYAGFRTLDSVARSRLVFGQDRLIIVSQRFHNYRALYIADRSGLDAVAFDAKDAPPGFRSRTYVREWFARTVALVDLHILHRKPHFPGPPEPIRFPQ